MLDYIEQIELIDDNINKHTEDFYISLGLVTILKLGSLKIYSTNSTHIKSFDKVIELNLDKKKYIELIQKKMINNGENKKQIYDNIGTLVTLTKRKTYENTRLGILTSGGDSPGMNSAMRSIIRYSLKNSIKVYGIYRGYDGLIKGDIRLLGWNSETDFSGQSGTYLLSARSDQFKTREGRKKAALNLLVRNISALVIKGGEGTMKGALMFKNEFKELCKEILEEEKMSSLISQKAVRDNSNVSTPCSDEGKNSLDTEKISDIIFEYSNLEISNDFDNIPTEPYDLQIIGIPGTIDNDIMGTDYTLGSDTALNRVAEIVEKLNSTMRSHKRVFVLECMGRNCGWITLMAGYAIEADYIIIPEVPPKDWKKDMIDTVKTVYYNHKRNVFVFISEGAVDSDGNRILTKEVEEEIRKSGLEVRSLVIGHVQRGGMTTSKDRFLGTMFGIKAVEYIIDGYKEAVMVANVNDEFTFVNLEEIVKKAEDEKIAFNNKEYSKVLQMRSKFFQNVYEIYERHRKDLVRLFFNEHLYSREYMAGYMHANEEKKLEIVMKIPECITKMAKTTKKQRIGFLTEGPCSCGMNTILNSLVQYGLCRNFDVFYFFNGYEGLINGEIRQADIFEFSLGHNQGGTIIGTSVSNGLDIDLINKKIEEYQLDYLIIAGGTINIKIAVSSSKIIIIPCTVANNFPGTDMSIGSETALNAISVVAESCRLTAASINKTVFIIEIGGGKCGFLTVMGGISCAVFDTLRPLSTNIEDLILIKKKIKLTLEMRKRASLIIFRNESSFEYISTKSLCEIICNEDKIRYNWSVLGHLECGIFPSIIDRINSRLSAYKAIESCVEGVKSGIIGIDGDQVSFKRIEMILKDYDSINDTVINPKWEKYSKICSTLE